MRKTFRCPVCKKSLSETEYKKALHIVEHKDQNLKKFKDQLALTKEKVVQARSEGIKAERERSNRLTVGLRSSLTKAKERIKQLELGKTPQSQGFAFEKTLLSNLKKHFKDTQDDIQKKGQGGDVLHIVIEEGKEAGCIIYECKRTPTIEPDHIRQAYANKEERSAVFAVLVTSGKKKGFAGLAEIDGVLIVSPEASIALASLLRAHVVEMHKARLTQDEKKVVAQKLLKYVTSPEFKNPLMGITRAGWDLERLLRKEMKSLMKDWEKRWENYQIIHWNNGQIQSNINRVIGGGEPIEIEAPMIQPLALPKLESKTSKQEV
jgi:hypothetical protein